MGKEFKGKDIISINNLKRNEIDLILDVANEIEKNPHKYENCLNRKIMIPLFFEPSTRTKMSFQMAMMQMGGNIIDFNPDLSSRKKGETLRDTSRMVNGYNPNVVIIRHNKDGSAQLVADVISCPVINAGDGQNQHPTQTLLDLYTIKELRGKIDGTKIIMAGDLKYGRTVHSLLTALNLYKDCNVTFISPKELRMPSDFIKDANNVKIEERDLSDLEKSLRDVDIIYMTRIQRERFPKGFEGDDLYEKISRKYCLTLDMLENSGNSHIKIMHPLPKITEVDKKVDDSKYASFWKQAENGLYVRKSLLYLVTGGKNEE